MIDEWFVIPSAEKNEFRVWLLGHIGYGFQQTKTSNDIYINSVPSIYNADKGDVTCKLVEGNGNQEGNTLVTFSFKEGTLDEGLLGLIRQNFTVKDSSCY